MSSYSYSLLYIRHDLAVILHCIIEKRRGQRLREPARDAASAPSEDLYHRYRSMDDDDMFGDDSIVDRAAAASAHSTSLWGHPNPPFTMDNDDAAANAAVSGNISYAANSAGLGVCLGMRRGISDREIVIADSMMHRTVHRSGHEINRRSLFSYLM